MSCDSPWVMDWEKFEIEQHADRIAFKGHFGKYIRTYSEGRLQIDSNVHWDWELFYGDRSDNKFYFKGYHGKYICAYQHGTLRCDTQNHTTTRSLK
jgi:hypothetical protein